MKLRRLTPAGIEAFAAYLTNLKAEPMIALPEYLLEDVAYSEPVAGDIDIEKIAFATRFDAAAYLDAKLASVPNVERDAGLWAWLTLLYFDQVCPTKSGAARKVGETARYLPAIENFQRFYRHLLLGPYMIYRAHSDDPQRARGVLASSLSSPGDIVEQLASRQELITNRAVMGLVTALYLDPDSKKLKRGSGGKANGSPRRLADILNQFDVTYDLYSMTSAALIGLLPKEFERFKATQV